MALVVAAKTQVGAVPWLVVGWVGVGVGILSGVAMLVDIVRGRREQMAIMNWVWPITGLYFGPLAVYFFRHQDRIPGASVSKGVTHCGAGCTLGDLCGEWIVYLTGWAIGIFAAEAANTLMAMYVADFTLAWAFGIAFQYFSIVPMREDVGRLEGVWAAIKADTLSILAFQVGLFGYMALYHLVLWKPPLSIASPTYWFMMQVGMVVGFFTAWPVNAWLIRRGLKEKM